MSRDVGFLSFESGAYDRSTGGESGTDVLERS